MKQVAVNIVSFDIPFPANYGGTIDIFYKLKALHKQGVKIYLHCFQYNKNPQQELEQYCHRVYYYKRQESVGAILSKLPYIVRSRNHRELLHNLLQNSHPILFEGLHSCFFLDHPKLRTRKKIVRTHNIEHHYYKGLYKASRLHPKKLYYALEAWKLKHFEKKLRTANQLLCISPEDTRYFTKKYGKACFMPAFHPFDEIISVPGAGDYLLYHGNLAVEENEKAVLYLLEHIIPRSSAHFIIAGKNPSEKLISRATRLKNVKLIINPPNKKMEELVLNAGICILPTFQSTGMKLKLLYSLFAGRHVIATPKMVKNTGLEPLCHIAETPEEILWCINRLKGLNFTEKMRAQREKMLHRFSNHFNVLNLINILKD